MTEGQSVFKDERSARAAAEFSTRVERALEQGRFTRLVLSQALPGEPDLDRVLVRAITLRDQTQLSFVWRYGTRDETHNLPIVDGLDQLRHLLGQRFRQAHLFAQGEQLQLIISKRGQCTLRAHAVAEVDPEQVDADAADAHDRVKVRLIDPTAPFLRELGVTDANGQIIPAMARKWRQINKFVEIVGGALTHAPLENRERVRVVDFGAGKGYLTFALYDFLHQQGLQVDVVGVELRADLVKLCNSVVAKLGLQGLRFEQGDISTAAPAEFDVMIALHACDTATDHAIFHGVRAHASLIVCSPCCHKELRPKLLSPKALQPLLRHGVHLGQEAEMLTDGLRALLLDACGYDAQVFEFVALSHTNKNKMILAVKRAAVDATPPDTALGEIDALKAFYGVRDQCLETLLRGQGLL